MDMRAEWIDAFRSWAAGNNSIAELWLFGSRAKGTARQDSDVDVAVLLIPPTGKTNWALFNYVKHLDDWKADLARALDWPIGLTLIGPNTDMDAEVRKTGVRIWRR
jgi:predicted nucleotidyltransferase